MIIEKDITELVAGSYVVDIVEPKDKYKINHPGFVKDSRSIEYLIQQGVLRVRIDTSKSLENEARVELSTEPAVDDAAHRSTAAAPSEPVMQKWDESEDDAGFTERLVESKELFDEAKGVQEKVLSEIMEGKPVDPEPVAEFTSQSIDTIFDNPDALACVINIRNKDQYLLEHSVSVSVLISIFGRYLELDKDLVQELAIGAFLHDVGKVMIPDHVLNKPGKLTDAEFEVMKMHAVHSRKIVYKTDGLSELTRQIVSNHHEKLDGKGYPLGKSAEELDRYDRMITICDIYDALCAHRVYKQGIAQIKAFAILRELAEMNHLDKTLVGQFIKCMGVYPVGSLVKLTSDRLAIVDGRNTETPTKPKVKAFFSLRQNAFVPTTEIDLSKSDEEEIEKGVRAEDFDLDMNKITEFIMMQG